jgi:hypothetical protein
MSDVGFSADLHPVLVNPHKQRRTYSMRLGRHRFGYTRDPGEAALFSRSLYETSLRAVVRECAGGRIIEDRDLGSGLVTNVGVLALAYDSQLTVEGKNKVGFNLFANLAYHQWGGKETAAATTDLRLTEALINENTKSAIKAVKDTSHTVTASGEGKPKFVSTAKIEAKEVGPVAIKEWGIFTYELLEATNGTGEKFETVSATTGKIAAANEFTESTTEVLGERLKLAYTEGEAKADWLLVTSNTKRELKGPAWYKQSTGAVEEPNAVSKFKMIPVMFDHRTFASINVEKGNVIEFPWELEIKSGG